LKMHELKAGLDEIRRAPKNQGTLDLIVRRPLVEQREILRQGDLDLAEGLVGDSWMWRGSSHTPDGSSDPKCQITIMNSRAVALVAQAKERWSLAGDQLFIDMDLSLENLPAGTLLSIGSAIIEVTNQPHTGCKKFVSRFGLDAMKFVNSAIGRQLNLRGINARVVQAGTIRVSDTVSKMVAEVASLRSGHYRGETMPESLLQSSGSSLGK
ncbi:MAG TPA: hypothetical protein VI756_27350, partial [Blastocatellia bacterium]